MPRFLSCAIIISNLSFLLTRQDGYLPFFFFKRGCLLFSSPGEAIGLSLGCQSLLARYAKIELKGKEKQLFPII